MKGHFGVRQGAAISLEKRLPVASGIGGGSADSAATARLLNRLWRIGAEYRELERLLAPLGADVPACVRSKAAYGEGVGAELSPVSDEDIKGRAVLLVNPLQPVSTGLIFQAWDGVDRGELDRGNPWQAALAGRNDLASPAITICPIIADVLAVLGNAGADLVRMSGSGATCFALFGTDAARDAAQREVNETCPQWWTMASSLR